VQKIIFEVQGYQLEKNIIYTDNQATMDIGKSYHAGVLVNHDVFSRKNPTVFNGKIQFCIKFGQCFLAW
jgi:hypothetical protein